MSLMLGHGKAAYADWIFICIGVFFVATGDWIGGVICVAGGLAIHSFFS